MIKHNLKTLSTVIIFLIAGIYIFLFVTSQDLSSVDWGQALKLIPKTISINAVIWFLFIKWGWKWKIFYPWLVQFPNLSGDWEGHLKSNWVNPKTGEKPDPIETSVLITQSFFHIQVGIVTGESKSYSISGSFDIDRDRGLNRLIYSYQNEPEQEVRHRSEIHYGTSMLNFQTGSVVNELKGQYWTDRSTTGGIELKRAEWI